jgi:hypothetical protein
MEPRVSRLTDQSGQVVVFMAVAMTALVGFGSALNEMKTNQLCC